MLHYWRHSYHFVTNKIVAIKVKRNLVLLPINVLVHLYQVVSVHPGGTYLYGSKGPLLAVFKDNCTVLSVNALFKNCFHSSYHLQVIGLTFLLVCCSKYSCHCSLYSTFVKHKACAPNLAHQVT